MSSIEQDAPGLRFLLTRRISMLNDRRVLFLMLNPSSADQDTDDPTIRRCKGFVRTWGCGWLDVVTLFPLRSPHPRDLIDWHRIPERRHLKLENLQHINAAARRAHLIVAAWGGSGALHGAGPAMMRHLWSQGYTVTALGMTKSGQPRHPLYVRRDARPRELKRRHAGD